MTLSFQSTEIKPTTPSVLIEVQRLTLPEVKRNKTKYPVAVAVSDVLGDGSSMHTHDHGGSEAPDGSPDSILSSGPKPLGKHKPPPCLLKSHPISHNIYGADKVLNHYLSTYGGSMYRDGGSRGDSNAAVTASIRACVDAILSVWIWVGYPDDGSNVDGTEGGDSDIGGDGDGSSHAAEVSQLLPLWEGIWMSLRQNDNLSTNSNVSGGWWYNRLCSLKWGN
ncbi:hypothetical protein Tco_1102706 [Tanacetum coccineum]